MLAKAGYAGSGAHNLRFNSSNELFNHLGFYAKFSAFAEFLMENGLFGSLRSLNNDFTDPQFWLLYPDEPTLAKKLGLSEEVFGLSRQYAEPEELYGHHCIYRYVKMLYDADANLELTTLKSVLDLLARERDKLSAFSKFVSIIYAGVPAKHAIDYIEQVVESERVKPSEAVAYWFTYCEALLGKTLTPNREQFFPADLVALATHLIRSDKAVQKSTRLVDWMKCQLGAFHFVPVRDKTDSRVRKATKQFGIGMRQIAKQPLFVFVYNQNDKTEPVAVLVDTGLGTMLLLNSEAELLPRHEKDEFYSALQSFIHLGKYFDLKIPAI